MVSSDIIDTLKQIDAKKAIVDNLRPLTAGELEQIRSEFLID